MKFVRVLVQASALPDQPAAGTSLQQSAFGPACDPADWSSVLSGSLRADIVGKIRPEFTFPRRECRSFHHHYFYHTLVNGEKIKWSWLTYSRKRD